MHKKSFNLNTDEVCVLNCIDKAIRIYNEKKATYIEYSSNRNLGAEDIAPFAKSSNFDMIVVDERYGELCKNELNKDWEQRYALYCDRMYLVTEFKEEDNVVTVQKVTRAFDLLEPCIYARGITLFKPSLLSLYEVVNCKSYPENMKNYLARIEQYLKYNRKKKQS